jgi:hypothetical protein
VSFKFDQHGLKVIPHTAPRSKNNAIGPSEVTTAWVFASCNIVKERLTCTFLRIYGRLGLRSVKFHECLEQFSISRVRVNDRLSTTAQAVIKGECQHSSCFETGDGKSLSATTFGNGIMKYVTRPLLLASAVLLALPHNFIFLYLLFYRLSSGPS